MLKFLVLSACVVSAAFGALNLDSAALNEFVKGHNDLRDATGAGMAHLAWSNELASFAASRTDLCIFQHDPTRTYGENIYWTSADDVGAADGAKDAVASWASEITRVDPDWNCAFDLNHQTTCGHYSQQVWAATTHVGCSVTNCPGDGTYVTCEYDPPGNMKVWDWDLKKAVNQKPY